MGKTRFDGPRHSQQSMILVLMKTPGVQYDALCGHAEINFGRCRQERVGLSRIEIEQVRFLFSGDKKGHFEVISCHLRSSKSIKNAIRKFQRVLDF